MVDILEVLKNRQELRDNDGSQKKDARSTGPGAAGKKFVRPAGRFLCTQQDFKPRDPESRRVGLGHSAVWEGNFAG